MTGGNAGSTRVSACKKGWWGSAVWAVLPRQASLGRHRRTFRMVPASTARHVALDLIGAVLGRERPLDEAIDDSAAMAKLSLRDRAFARLLVATVLRRLGQIDALIGD